MINHIFLDLDGVISDFDDVYKRYTPESWREQHFRSFVLEQGFIKLKKLPDADLLLEYLDSLEIPITILSSAGGFDEFYHDIVLQKQLWLADNNIKYPALVVPSKSHKKLYARRDALLIDDLPINIQDFVSAGGIGIVHKMAISTIALIERTYDDLTGKASFSV